MAEKSDLWTKAHANIEAIETMTPKERGQTPTGGYGDNYNALRRLVLEHYAAEEDLFPPAVKVVTTINQARITRAAYVELLAYFKELKALLDRGAA